MKRFIKENTSFKITVVNGKKNPNGVIDCRNGHEIGDTYHCEYGCPAEFCQKSMLKVFPIMEAARADGNLINLGGDSPTSIKFCCPDGVVTFRLEVIKKHERTTKKSPDCSVP
ncbi:MAG: TIGR04076 family protein [Clostridia bacterium]|nr:TIGR04076 family protein [Clostridia bacterium]